ncbi:hypothetical protein [Flavobacterium terrigena]|uniref:Uncharacterized protein n=1 Tax=Flavobacterium terrigena TaxID=402734 RepID=A0A1H6S730_9FLAO|nr:hypothetical protein [Flavobacterium terrigena]SEI63751.1 hypothetical protein SAMN05660918_1235 [Flavobacterium terrigena]
MSTSNSPQTLFRFVSLRNPNLAENSEKNFKFIFRPLSITGFFDQVTSNSSDAKFKALINLANSFSANAIKTVDELDKEEFSALLKIGKSLYSNNKLSSTELKLAKDFHTKLKSNNEALKKLWDNLIYQYITQNNFYIKEAIAHILKAYHIGFVQTQTSNEELSRINGENYLTPAYNSKIVLPQFLFQENNILISKRASSTKELSESDNQLLQINLEKQESLYSRELDNQNLKVLKEELKNIENSEGRISDKLYNQSYSKYQKENGGKIAKYQNQLEIIQELEENKASDEEIKKAYELLKTYEYPTFEFENKKPLNWDDLYSNLTEESFALFLENFTNAKTVIKEPIDFSNAEISIVSNDEISIDDSIISINYDDFSEIHNEIDTMTQALNTSVLSDSVLSQDEFINIGNVLIPVSSDPIITSFTHLSYILRATNTRTLFITNRGFVTFQIQLENSSWNISHATISAQTNLGAQNETFSNLNVVNNTLTFPQFLINKFRTISNLSIQIFFANGRESVLQLNNIVVNQDIKGILTLKPIKEELPIDTNPTEPNPVSGKHFGLKRLGVAEYMKVVQTVHAYVPGEVSNIENVMASELRHKSINELTRIEDTTTTSKSQEVEKISDTTKTNRAEMQTEVARELEKQQSFQAHANFTYDAKAYKLDIGTAFATNNSQFISNRQAVTKAQEVTERAMERVQSKITEERILKIIQEVSLTNVHEFDNRGGLSETRPQHITGVYRWVDKKMKNQIFNYGKRTMFEFMIPEPAKLHRLAYANVDTLKAPVDPRKAPAPHTMPNSNSSTKALLEYWANVYGVSLTEEPQNKEQILKANGSPHSEGGGVFYDSNLEILENYEAKSAVLNWYFTKQRNRSGWFEGNYTLTAHFNISNLKGQYIYYNTQGSSRSGSNTIAGLNLSETFNYKVHGQNIGDFSVEIKLQCQPKVSFFNAWKLENFNAIIAAYKVELEEYKAEKARIDAERKANEENQKEAQANFYRIIENDVLKHNCIAYLLQNYLITLGQSFTEGDKMLNFKVNLSDDLDKYTATAKFLEQAFEWSIMDYTFYPYYWADRKMWQEMYLTENIDTLFRGFLQAGLARVIVTVKPGFEEAVQYFLTTGKVWMGGETPIIGDPLYVSIMQEMQDPTGIPQGNYWITRIPTTLTILQAKSTGLEVDQPLPIFPESEPEKCENPTELETQTAFIADDVQMVGSERSTTLYPSN